MSMEKKLYRDAMQKKGVSLPNPQHPAPSNANPVTKLKPGLGGKQVPHPFKAGKKAI